MERDEEQLNKKIVSQTEEFEDEVELRHSDKRADARPALISEICKDLHK